MIVVLAAVLGPYVYIHFIEGPAPAKLELPKSSGHHEHVAGISLVTSSSLDGSLERRRGLAGGLPRPGGPGRPERHCGRSYQQDLGLHDDLGFDRDQGDLHRRHGERRERPE